jgi:hypothetical protein
MTTEKYEVVIRVQHFEFGSHSGSYGDHGFHIFVGLMCIGYVKPAMAHEGEWLFIPTDKIQRFPFGEPQAIAAIVNQLQEDPDG